MGMGDKAIDTVLITYCTGERYVCRERESFANSASTNSDDK